MKNSIDSSYFLAYTIEKIKFLSSKSKVLSSTSYIMTTKFRNIHIIKVGQTRILKKALTPVQQIYVAALGLTEAIFTDPRPPP